mmetsp:Transcript_15490/g.38192  ORF Transcript_15490/g.38192 Transcript_15490/m.38192 type:complete len:235 (+) Transcript_15490:3287-3991(+)
MRARDHLRRPGNQGGRPHRGIRGPAGGLLRRRRRRNAQVQDVQQPAPALGPRPGPVDLGDVLLRRVAQSLGPAAPPVHPVRVDAEQEGEDGRRRQDLHRRLLRRREEDGRAQGPSERDRADPGDQRRLLDQGPHGEEEWLEAQRPPQEEGGEEGRARRDERRAGEVRPAVVDPARAFLARVQRMRGHVPLRQQCGGRLLARERLHAGCHQGGPRPPELLGGRPGEAVLPRGTPR